MGLLGRIFGGEGAARAAQQMAEPLDYPADVQLEGDALTLRFLERGDRDAVLAFARGLPAHDLLFLPRDITEPEVIDQWLRDVEEGYYTTVVATLGGRVVGYASVAGDRLDWMRHVAELQVLISEEMRGRRLGRVLTEQAFALAKQRGVQKMVAHMTTDQEAAIRVFARMGFRREGRLRNQVIDRHGALHDLQIMSLDIDRFRME